MKTASPKNPALFLVLLSSFLPVFLSCGKKGPPQPPLDLSPGAAAGVTARRLGDRVYLTFRIPSVSSRGTGPFSVDHMDVFAATVAPGTPVPANRFLVQKPQTIATIPVRPPENDEEKPADGRGAAEAATHPAPGDTTTFVETLSPDDLRPTVIPEMEQAAKKAEEAAKKAKATGPAAAPAATPPAPVGPPVLTRYYVIRGVAKNGRPGAPSARIEVPLLAPPAPPRRGAPPSWDAASVTINWDPPPSRTDEAPGVLYNVYPAPAGDSKADAEPPAPLNPAPLDATSFTHQGAEPDREQCFVVRSVAAAGGAPATPAAAAPAAAAAAAPPAAAAGAAPSSVAVESEPSEPICVTPKDTFPPAAPKSLAAVGSAGVINLIWDASTEPDLAGYIVLRGEAAGGTLQPLTREPIKETRYADRAVQPGVRYAYQLIAVDKAGNRSAASNRVEEAAR